MLASLIKTKTDEHFSLKINIILPLNRNAKEKNCLHPQTICNRNHKVLQMIKELLKLLIYPGLVTRS